MPTKTQARHWKSHGLGSSSKINVVHSSDPFPDPLIEVIALNSAVYTADQTMEDFAKELVRSALLDARMGAVGDQQMYGNPCSLRALEDRERNASLREDLDELKRKVASHDAAMEALEHRVSALEPDSAGYRRIKHRVGRTV